MALHECGDCGKPYLAEQAGCPYCGSQGVVAKRGSGWLVLLLTVVLAGVLFLAARGNSHGSVPVNALHVDNDLIGMALLLLIGVAALLIYFLPAIVASMRNHASATAITVLNLFLGWTFVGWVIALVWACNSSPAPVELVEATKNAFVDNDSKTCPFCAETIRAAAIKCKHCGSNLA